MDRLLTFIPFVTTLLIVIILLRVVNWALLGRHPEMGNEKRFTRQLIMLGLTLVGLLMIALTLPVTESTRNQIIAFLGLVVSGTFAFSSTTILANLMAGLMMRITRPFRAGDFIRVRDYFGRVAERGLLDTEIQTETRELIAVPNTYLIANPVSVIRSSGTVVSASLSLGYDLPHGRIERLLKEAAKAAGLEEPFVHISQLGDFSITYKVNGLLKDVKSVLTARTALLRCVLDTLHRDGIEIVSPSFMNQRPLPDGQRFIPPEPVVEAADEDVQAEKIVFDKAEEAEKRELQKLRLSEKIQLLEEKLTSATAEERTALETQRTSAKEALAALEKAPETSTS